MFLKNKKSGAGFTLIELLVVVAIVALLASIVMSNLKASRDKSKDAAIKDNLFNIRTQAGIIFSVAGCYADTADSGHFPCADIVLQSSACNNTGEAIFSNPVIKQQLQSAVNNSGSGYPNTKCVVLEKGTAWAVSVPLKTNPDSSWCVDSNGAARAITTGTLLTAVCPEVSQSYSSSDTPQL